MTPARRTFLMQAAAALALPLPARAAPLAYRLDAERSTVAFGYSLGGAPWTGTMPVTEADITLDFERAAASQVSVNLNPGAADAGNAFATDAMKSAGVLDTARYQRITFVSTAIRPAGDKAEVDGEITIRNVTRPLRLSATIYRPRDSTAGERSRLTVELEGSLDRRAFGASGYADLVGPQITLQIVARLLQGD